MARRRSGLRGFGSSRSSSDPLIEIRDYLVGTICLAGRGKPRDNNELGKCTQPETPYRGRDMKSP